MEDTGQHGSEIDDPLFDVSKGLFDNKEILRLSWVPDGSRIVGRDPEISSLSNDLSGAVVGNSPSHVAIVGKTGTGKSLVTRFVANRACSASVTDVSVGVAYVDCSESSTEAQLVSTLGQKLNDTRACESNETEMPDTGLSKSKFYERLWDITDCYDSAIIILDEVDLLRDNIVLRNLAKSVEKRSTTCNLGVIAISNVIGYFSQLDPRTKSVFQVEPMVFDPYDAKQIEQILTERTDAFKSGVISGGVVSLTAALSAKEHGDARKAVRLLRTSGEVAESGDESQIEEHHVREAENRLDENKFLEFIKGTPKQMKIVALTLASFGLWGNTEYVMTGKLYEMYSDTAGMTSSKVITIRRFRDILSEMSMHRVVESEVKEMHGEHNGHRLLYSPEVVKKSITSQEPFTTVKDTVLKDIVRRNIRA